MLKLIINTASTEHELLLIDNHQIIESKQWIGHRDETDNLLNYIEDLLKSQQKETQHNLKIKTNFKFSDLKQILVINGPGGFTSLRVGITIANTLAYSLKIPIQDIKLFDWWQFKINIKDYVILHSANRRDIFVQGLGKYQQLFPKFKLLPWTVFLEKIKDLNNLPYLGDLVDLHQFTQGKILPTNYDQTPTYLINLPQPTLRIIEPFYGRQGQVV